MFSTLLRAFADATSVHIALLLVILDLVLGVLAAFKMGTFRLSYVADTAKTDILYKLFPYFLFFAAAHVAGGQDAVIPGLDVAFIADGIYVLIVGAWVGSILGSLYDLGLRPAPENVDRSPAAMLAGGENAAPPVG